MSRAGEAFTPKHAVAVLVAAFRSESITDATIALYVRKLAELPPALLAGAVNRVIDRAKFFPSISELRTAACEAAGLVLPSPDEAAAIVRASDRERQVCRRDGSYAYTEREWQWPEEVPDEVRDAICLTIERVGEPVGPDGKPIFAWEQGFKRVYEKIAVAEAEEKLAALALPGQLSLGPGVQALARVGGSEEHTP